MFTIQQKFNIQQKVFRVLEFLANPIISILVLSAGLALMYVLKVAEPITLVVLTAFTASAYFRLWFVRRRTNPSAPPRA